MQNSVYKRQLKELGRNLNLPRRLLFTVMDRWQVCRKISSAFAWFIWAKLCPFTSKIWSPRFRPTSSALLPFSTLYIPRIFSVILLQIKKLIISYHNRCNLVTNVNLLFNKILQVRYTVLIYNTVKQATNFWAVSEMENKKKPSVLKLMFQIKIRMIKFITLEINMPKPLSYPPKMEKWRISSLLGLVRVTVLALAFVAQAKSNKRSWPAIFSLSKPSSNCSKKFIMAGSISKSVKWLFTHNNTTLVTLSRNDGSSNLYSIRVIQ